MDLVEGFGQIGVAPTERGEAGEKFREQFGVVVEEFTSPVDVESGEDFG